MISFEASNFIRLPANAQLQVDRLNIEDLVREIERHRPLWDTSCEEYASKQDRDRHWDEVIARFLPDYQERSAAERHQIGSMFRKRWKSMRTCFARELCRQRSAVGRFRRKYLYYDLLRFLDPVTKTLPNKGFRGLDGVKRNPKRASTKRAKPEVEEDDEEEEEKEEEYTAPAVEEANAPSQPQPSRPQPSTAQPSSVTQPSMVHMAQPMVMEVTPPVNDEADRMFLMSLVADFQCVPARKKTRLKVEILEAIARAQGEPEDRCHPSASRSVSFAYADVSGGDPGPSLMDLAEVKMEGHDDSGSEAVQISDADD